jgi:hypothetical protein
MLLEIPCVGVLAHAIDFEGFSVFHSPYLIDCDGLSFELKG